MLRATQIEDTDNDRLFSDTSDDSSQEGAIQRPPVARVLDIPEEADDQDDESENWEWDINEDQAFLSLGLPDACIFTGRALAFDQAPLVQDAAQRSFNHLYLEEATQDYD